VTTEIERKAAWDDLESLIAEMQRSAALSGLSNEQLIDAECEEVRYGSSSSGRTPSQP
jgi:hypothetical protein